MKKIKRSQAKSGQILCPGLPITLPILRQLFKVWREFRGRDVSMLQAACCLGFFRFLRAAEFTVPSWETFEPGAHLTISDVAVDSHNDPSMLRIHIKQSKTDPFRKGVHFSLGRTHSDICPVTSISQYLAIRGPGNGPLLLFRDGSPLSRAKLVQRVRSALLYCRNRPTSLLQA